MKNRFGLDMCARVSCSSVFVFERDRDRCALFDGAKDDRDVAFLGFFPHGSQRKRHLTALSEDEHAARHSIQAMHELDVRRRMRRCAHEIDDGRALLPGPAVNGHAGGLCDHDDRIIFVKDDDALQSSRVDARGFAHRVHAIKTMTTRRSIERLP